MKFYLQIKALPLILRSYTRVSRSLLSLCLIIFNPFKIIQRKREKIIISCAFYVFYCQLFILNCLFYTKRICAMNPTRLHTSI